MAIAAERTDEANDAARVGRAATLALFTGALFLSAFLLFGVQPMFTKMVLPTLGGTPGVWSVASVFFQACLLAGYCYAHLLTRCAGLRVGAVVHLAVMGIAFLTLPIAMAAGWGRPPADGEALWLLGLFAVSVGAPFFAVSANGPLLQAWFARSGHPQASDPYFLYAASNVGSFAALAFYPLAIEPFLTLNQQSAAWSGGFALLGLSIAACAGAALLLARAARGAMPMPEIAPGADVAADVAVTAGRRVAWLLLSFVPSGLLVAVTAHISTDVAAAPLLWVVPLALFLLTFVIVFRRADWVFGGLMTRLHVWFAGLALMSLGTVLPLSMQLVVHLGLFFVTALVAHHALYRLRPPAARLTEFYLIMSLGGVLGGAFCGLAAPHLFNFVLEYPLLIVAGLMCRPHALATLRAERRTLVATLLIAAVVVAFAVAIGPFSNRTDLVRTGLIALLTVALMSQWRRPARAVPLAVVTMVTVTLIQSVFVDMTRLRSFFGVHKIATTADGRFRALSHGTTVHGAMRLENEDGTPATGRPEPTTYYTYEGGIGRAIAGLRATQGGLLNRVAAVGLGSGSVACHVRAGEDWTFFEIDPDVVRIARDPRFFRFLSDCAPRDIPIVLGDARLTLADDRGDLSLLLIDAFSSDSIPAHLVTAEALAGYVDKLSATGAIVIHISNRHLDLRHILARTAASQGLKTWIITDQTTERFESRYRASSVVALLARDEAHLGPLGADKDWVRMMPDMTRRPWTDDFSNIVEAMRDKARQP